MRKLEIKQLEKEHCKQIAAAALEEIELMTKPSSEGSSKGKTSELFTEKILFKSKKLVQDWVKSSPAENMAEAALQMNRVCTYALPGLSFNPKAVKVRKTAQFQLIHFFRDKRG